MTGDGKILLVHQFSLPRVSGITITIDELLRRIPEVAPAMRAAGLSFEGCRTPAEMLAALGRDHGDATCVVGINLHIEVDAELSRAVARWCADGGRPFYLYVHDYWPHHRPFVADLTSSYAAEVLAITPSIADELERDGFSSTIVPAGVPVALSNGVASGAVAPASRRKTPTTVAALGRLVPRKRFEDVVHGFCQADLGPEVGLEMRLLPSLVYPPERDRELLAGIRTVAGRCPRHTTVVVDQTARIPTDYRGWTVYISASDYEGLSITPIEAAVQGCPPLVSDIPPHRAIIEQLYGDGSADSVFPVADHRALADLLADEIRTGRRRAELARRRQHTSQLVERVWSLRTTASELVRLSGV
jgi:glycosyltransferase involved in cell wall biosynthesis